MLQPGIEGMVPFLTVPIVCTRSPSQCPDAVDVLLDGVNFAANR
jgi:hypothetical protein